MRRRAESRSACVGALVLALTLAAHFPTAAGAQSALEEYVLTLPGVETLDGSAAPDLDPGRNAGAGGVTGEREPAPAPIAAVGSTASRPAVVALSAGLALTAAMLWRRRRRLG